MGVGKLHVHGWITQLNHILTDLHEILTCQVGKNKLQL